MGDEPVADVTVVATENDDGAGAVGAAAVEAAAVAGASAAIATDAAATADEANSRAQGAQATADAALGAAAAQLPPLTEDQVRALAREEMDAGMGKLADALAVTSAPAPAPAPAPQPDQPPKDMAKRAKGKTWRQRYMGSDE
jgi:Zn-dependent alcohol dehydrogenase